MAASAPTLPAVSAENQAITWRLNPNRASHIPFGFYQHYAPHLTDVELKVLGLIRELTTFTPQLETSITKLAATLLVTDTSVKAALVKFQKQGVLEWEFQGNGVVVNPPKWQSFRGWSCRQARKWRKNQPDYVPPEAPAPKRAALACPEGLNCPITELYEIDGLITNTAAPQAVEVPKPISKPCGRKMLSGVSKPISEPPSPPARLDPSPAPADPAAVAALRTWCAEVLLPVIDERGHVAVMPDDAFLGNVIADLGTTPVEQLYALALSTKSMEGPGLLRALAGKARRTWESQEAQRKHQAAREAAAQADVDRQARASERAETQRAAAAAKFAAMPEAERRQLREQRTREFRQQDPRSSRLTPDQIAEEVDQLIVYEIEQRDRGPS